MALDIKLDFENESLINELTSGKDRVLQQIKIALRIWWGHWKWASEYGVDYQEKLRNKNIIKSQVSDMILQVDGVQKIVSISIEDKFYSNGQGELILNAIIYIDGEFVRLENEALASL